MSNRTKRPANRQTAEEAYDERARDLEKMIADLQEVLKKHRADFEKSGSHDWGYVGDLGHYRAEIRGMLCGSSYAPDYQYEYGE